MAMKGPVVSSFSTWGRTASALAILGLVAGCGSSNSSTRASNSTQVRTTSNASTPDAGISGRCEQVHTCQSLFRALNRAGLGAAAPYSVGDFFPGKTPQSLIHKTDLCKGAITFRHSHFFTHSGGFGSLDQSGNQVDSGSYRIIDAHTLSITNTDFSDAIFHYRIFRDNTLTLEPVITATERRQALADPAKFTKAVWMLSVVYPGTTWTRINCGGWC